MAEEIYKKIKVIQRGEKSYVSIHDTIDFIEACEKEGFCILGLEGIYCRENSTEPDMDLIADFTGLFKEHSKSNLVKESCSAAKKVILGFPIDDDLYVDFTLR